MYTKQEEVREADYKISSGPNREKPEEAGSWDGGAEAEGHL